MDADFHLGSWLVQPGLNTISRNGTTAQLEPKMMSVLVCLAEHQGEPVSKEKLLQTVWPDTFVSEGVLVRSISELRRVLGDDAKEPRVIQTIAKRGYRLVVPVTPVSVPVTEPSTSLDSEDEVGPPSRPKWISGLAVAAAALLLISFLVAANVDKMREVWARTSGPQIHSLAVLPLKNLSGDPSQDYFADGMTDELITCLAQISCVRVISYTSTHIYKDTTKTLPEIARELGVDGIVEGSVQRKGVRVRVNAQLVSAPQEMHLWAQSYERDMLDALAVQSTIAETIADQVKIKLIPSQQARLTPSRPVKLNALEAYMQGVHYYSRIGHGFGGEETKKAVEFLEQAISEDPGFTAAYIKLAGIYGNDGEPLSYFKGSVSLQRASIEKALSLDPNSSVVHSALGYIRLTRDWDWAGAETEFKRAVELNTNDPLAHFSLAEYWEAMGRLDQGMHERERAQELDPAMAYISTGFFRARDYDRGIEFVKKRLELTPNDGGLRHQLSTFYTYKGMEKEAIPQLQQAVALFGFDEAAQHMVGAYAVLGYRGALDVLVKDMEGAYHQGRFNRPDLLAEAYVRLGKKDEALRWLQRAYSDHNAAMAFLNVEPFWDPLRSDARFKDLVRRVGLPQ